MAVFKQEKDEDFDSEFEFGKFAQVGKTEARQSFLQLIDSLDGTSVTVTDRGEKVAVIMSYKHYQILLAILRKLSPEASRDPFAGITGKVGDLEQSKREVGALFKRSIKESCDRMSE